MSTQTSRAEGATSWAAAGRTGAGVADGEGVGELNPGPLTTAETGLSLRAAIHAPIDPIEIVSTVTIAIAQDRFGRGRARSDSRWCDCSSITCGPTVLRARAGFCYAAARTQSGSGCIRVPRRASTASATVTC